MKTGYHWIVAKWISLDNKCMIYGVTDYISVWKYVEAQC